MSLNADPRAVARNAASGYVTLVLGALLGLIATPVLLAQLGTAGFGIWSLILGTVAYIALLEAGLGTATITRIAAVEPLGSAAMSRVLSTSLGLFLLMAVAGLGTTVVLILLFPSIFDVPAELRGDSQAALLLMGLAQSVAFVMAVFTACLLGTGRMYVVTLFGFSAAAISTVAQIALLLAGGGLPHLAGVQLAAAIAQVLIFRRHVRRAYPDLRLGPSQADRGTARLLLGLGVRNSVSSVASVLAFGSDVVLVGLLLDPKAAAAYAVATRGFHLIHRAANGIVQALGPAHAHAARHASADARFRLFHLNVFATLALASLGGMVVGLFAEPLLELWLVEVPDGAPAVLTILGVVLVLQAPGAAAASVLVHSEQAGILMRITTSAAALNIVASVTFTALFGVIGPALGSLLAVALVDAVYLPWRVCRLMDRPYGSLLRRAVLPLSFALTGSALILATGFLLAPKDGWVLAVVAAGALFHALAVRRTRPAVEVMSRLRRRPEPAVSSGTP